MQSTWEEGKGSFCVSKGRVGHGSGLSSLLNAAVELVISLLNVCFTAQVQELIAA